MKQFCSFLWLSNIPLYICALSFLFIPVDGRLGCFHVLATVNSAAMNTGMHVSFGITVFLLVYDPGVGLLSHMVVLGFPGGTNGKEPACQFRPQGRKESDMTEWLNWTEETQVWSLSWEDPLEEGMATHSSILAWRIPWAEELGRLQSMGSHKVRHGWSDWAYTHTWWFYFQVFKEPLYCSPSGCVNLHSHQCVKTAPSFHAFPSIYCL